MAATGRGISIKEERKQVETVRKAGNSLFLLGCTNIVVAQNIIGWLSELKFCYCTNIVAARNFIGWLSELAFCYCANIVVARVIGCFYPNY